MTGFEQTMQKEMDRLENEHIADSSRDAIKRFLSYMKNREEVTDRRLYFYSQYLRPIARSLQGSFLKPTDDDIEKALSDQRERNLSEWTIENYKTTLKKFYSWLFKKKNPDCVAWIKRNNKPNYKQKPDFRISQEEIDLLIKACDNARDQALFSLLYDSGCRIGEVTSVKIRDVLPDEYGMRIIVTGKTGTRNVRVIGDSIGYVRAWINVHPDQFNDDAWLFCGIGHDMRNKSTIGDPMNHAQIYRMFSKVKKRAVVLGFPESKRIYPHKFRHNRATELTSKISASVLEKQMGWVPGTKQRAVYEHLNNDDVDLALLSASGIKAEKKLIESRKPKICLNCRNPNPANGKYCSTCGRPLDMDELKIYKEKEQEAISTVMDSSFVSENLKALLKSDPRFVDKMLDVIFTVITDNNQTKDNFVKEARERMKKAKS